MNKIEEEKKLICKDCGKELNEMETTTYMVLDHLNLIQDYVSILCKDCLQKHKDKL